MEKSKPPAAHQAFVQRFPRIGQAWDLVNEEGATGPLDAKTQRLLKLAIAVGAMREGAVHSGVRKARDAGASGGKICGAGGGGYLLLACRPERRDEVRAALETHGGRLATFDFHPTGAEAHAGDRIWRPSS